MTENSRLVTELYKSRNNLLEIMETRGFNVDDYNHFTITEVNSMKKNEQLDLLLSHKNNPDKKIFIKYYLGRGLRPNMIEDMVEELFHVEEILKLTDDLLIITKTDANDTLNKYIERIWETDKIFITILPIPRLGFNILDHDYVPEHTIIDKDEIVKKYNISHNSQFPDISRFDPVAMVIGLRPGQLCKIIRPSKTAINTEFYRLCS